MKLNKSIKYSINGGMFVLRLLKSLFYSVTQVAWGIASIFLLNIAIAYLMKSEQSINLISKTFLNIEALIINHIMIFVLIFFLVYVYDDIKQLKGGDK